MVQQSWPEIAQQCQEHRDKSIAKIQPSLPDVPSELPLNVTRIPQSLLSRRENDITVSSPEELVTSLATGQLSCIEVTNAFLRRAALAQKLVKPICSFV